VKKARADYESARYSFRASLALRYPSLSLQGNINTRYSSTASDFLTHEKVPYNDQLENNLGQQVSLGLTIPIFYNLHNSYSIQSAKFNYQNASISLREVEFSSRNDVYEAYYLMENAYNKLLAADNYLKAQQQLYEQNNVMFVEGILSYYDWQAAKTNYNKAQNAYLSAKYEYMYRIKIFDYYRGIPINTEN
jgi:outer membrane protein